jgi:hypothetical protein
MKRQHLSQEVLTLVLCLVLAVSALTGCAGEKDKQEGSFLFQGARVVLVRLADVSCVEVVSLIRKEEEASAE